MSLEVDPSDDCSPSPDYTLMTDPEPEPPKGNNPQELCEVINICCITLLRFKVICYTALDN